MRTIVKAELSNARIGFRIDDRNDQGYPVGCHGWALTLDGARIRARRGVARRIAAEIRQQEKTYFEVLDE